MDPFIKDTQKMLKMTPAQKKTIMEEASSLIKTLSDLPSCITDVKYERYCSNYPTAFAVVIYLKLQRRLIIRSISFKSERQNNLKMVKLTMVVRYRL